MERPASPEQHLWSSILDSVSSSRAIPSKNVILLGEPSSGKTTIANALLQKSSSGKTRDVPGNRDLDTRSAYDFALGYEWADIKDEAEEDTLARLSVYTVPSSSPAHLALLPHFVPAKTSLPNTAVMIVLDWTRPATFLDQLYTWLAWVDKWGKSEGSREVEVLRDEGRERLQSHLQHYTEPGSTVEATPLPGGNAAASTLLPLPQGSFTHNPAGVPIIVVCSKADMIDNAQGTSSLGLGVSKAKGGDWEERTDGVMQVLRTICLKYGAAMFYTSMSQPVSLTQLRAYTLHFLFMPPAPPPDTPPLKYLFPFRQRPNLLDRDRIALPAGWDTWGKIGFVRENFDCAKWSEAWDKELEDGGNGGATGAKALYAELIGIEDTDKGLELPALITTEPEQAFLARHYETLQKDPGRDPRATFKQPPAGGEQSTAGVVGPLGSSTFSLPNVEKAMVQMEGEDMQARLARLSNAGVPRRDPRAPAGGAVVNGTGRPVLSTATNAVGAGGSNPNSPLPRPGAQGRSQHDILQNFFNNLIQTRPGNRAATNAQPSSSAAAAPAVPVAGSEAPARSVELATTGAESAGPSEVPPSPNAEVEESI